MTGDAAPNTGGASYDLFGPIVLDAAGRAAFTATLAQGGAVDAGNDLGMWSEGSGALALVERRGSPAVGTTATWDAAIAPPVLNDSGQVAFLAFTNGGPIGVWSEGSGVLAPAALTGSQADGVPLGQNYAAALSEPSFNDAGQVAFHGTLSGTGVTTSEGQSAPGAGGATFTDFEGTRLATGGDVAFRATLSDGGSGIWAGAPGAVQLAARDGSAAAGTTGQFANFVAGDFGDLGQVAFEAGLEVGVGGVSAGDDRGVWAGAPGAVSLIAREGEIAPGTGGRVFESFSGPLINGAGAVLLRGFLDTGTGLFLHDGALGKVVASGDTAPGTSIGLGAATFAAFTDYALNDNGEVAFTATLAGVLQGVTGSNDGSLWLRDRNDVLTLIVREGMLWQLGLGDFAIVASIDFTGGPDSRARGLNDDGAVAFHLTFTDGREGVFIAAVPEPGTAAILALGLAAMARRRRLW
ncbi:MAG: PEP-CTERM sorting domain-containing protein [Deltaproteobacteria bacterium]|nr:MAG: PEP-CTERM sorting domain-containing protein [Deltaproteobacteria bacterium]